jgi:hypothetical protein
LSGSGRLQYSQFIVKCDTSSVSLGLNRSERRPERVERNVGIQLRRVVKGDLFQLLEGCRQVVELGKSTASFGFNLGLDRSEPSSLKLNALSNDFFSESASRI